MSELVSLEEWNKKRREFYNPKYPLRNGIACPKCGEELMDTDGCNLMSNPPQRRVECSCCSHTGYRVA